MRDRHIGKSEKFSRHGNGRLEGCLEGRLIPTRKDPACVSGLELGRNHPLAAVRGRIIDREKAAAETVDAPGERDADLVRPGRKRMRKRERNGLHPGLRCNRRHLPRFTRERRRLHDHVEGIEDQAIGGRQNLDIHNLRAGNRAGDEIRPEIDRVVCRHDVLREPARRRGKGINGLGARCGAAPNHERRDECARGNLNCTKQGELR